MKEYFKKLLDGTNDAVSSKRFAGLVSLASAMILAGFGAVIDMNTHYFDGFLYFAGAALAISGLTKLSNGSK